MACINDVLSLHLLVEVLARLPLRHVFQCKSVCKLWLSCIQDSCFIGRFVQLNEEKNDDLQQKQMIPIPAATNINEMLMIQPSCSISVTASQVSLDFLPFLAEWVPPPKGTLNLNKALLASNNGLLVCTPKNSQYYICNPLTRQWLALPRPPPSKKMGALGVAFICDSRFGLNLVRLLISNHATDGNPPEMSAELFSSKTGGWSTLELPDDIVNVLFIHCPPVSYKGKIHWLLRDGNFMIYDPETKKFLMERVANGLPAEELCIIKGTSRHRVGFGKLSVCQESFWISQTLNGYVRVFRLVNGVWSLVHNVDACSEMQCSSSSVQQELVNGVRYGDRLSYYGAPFLDLCALHPSDPMIAYMSLDTWFLECNFRDRTMQVLSQLSGHKNHWFNGLTLSLPPWPTPLPAL